MPFARDTLTAIRARIQADIAARLPGSDPYVRRSPLNVLASVLAGLQNNQFGYLDWQARQDVPFTAEGEYALGWGALKGKTLKPATAAAGTATISGGVPTSPIPFNTEYTRSDGALFRVVAGTSIGGGGGATLSLLADTPGIAGNSDLGTLLTIAAPLEGVPATAAIVTMEGGAEVEDIPAFRTRYLEAFANPPQGGDLADYISWALEVAGVTRAWAGPSTIMGAGSVTVYFMLDDASHPLGLPIGTNGVSQFEARDTPAVGDQLLVADHIFPLRPVTALVYTAAPVSTPLNITLSEVPVDTAIRDGITAALNGFILREASPGGVLLPDLSPGGTLRLSHLDSALSAVPGLDHFILVSPVADVTVTTGHISTPGLITFL